MSSRLADFKSRFSKLFGAKSQGYEEVPALERPLVGAEDAEDEEREHGSLSTAVAFASGPPSAYERPPAAVGAGRARPAAAPALYALPCQADELQEVAVLAKDAAEILWEMVLVGEAGPEVADMRAKAAQLQSQLRGLIGDDAGGDEAVLASAIEAFDMLTRCLEEQEGGGGAAQPEAPLPAKEHATLAAPTKHAPPATLAPPPSAAPPAAAPPTVAAAAPTAPPPATATAGAPASAAGDLISFD